MIRIASDVLDLIIAEYEINGGEAELCGFVIAEVEIGTHVAFVPNVAANPRTWYEMEAGSNVEVHQYIEDNNLTMLATFHTHPDGGARPSASDVHHAVGPWQLIVGREDGVVVVRGFTGDFTAEVAVDSMATSTWCCRCNGEIVFETQMRVNDPYLCSACGS